MGKRKKRIHKQSLNTIAVLVVLIIVIVGGSLWFAMTAGSRHDRQVSADLSQIQTDVELYAAAHQTLPPALNALPLTSSEQSRVVKNHYTYSKTGTNSYLLCSTFSTDTTSASNSQSSDILATHKPGKNCYSLSAPGILH